MVTSTEGTFHLSSGGPSLDQTSVPPVSNEELLNYQTNQNSVITLIRQLIALRKKLLTLETIKGVLAKEVKEQEESLHRLLETFVPDDVRCPICFEVYQEQIFQCQNGHALCGACGKSLIVCPECRVPYGTLGKIRNRAMEGLLKNNLTVDCICGKKLEVKQVGDHAKGCVENRQGGALHKLEHHLNFEAISFGGLNEQLLDKKMKMVRKWKD